MKITNDDLKKNKYTMEELKNNIYCVSLLEILKTQKLTVDFCVNYLLNDDFHLVEEETNISMYLITQYQPHISYIELQKALLDYESDDEYIIDFEIISNLPMKKVDSNVK